MKKRCLKKIFVVGSPRSGTTYLQSLLLNIDKSASYPETHYFQRIYGGKNKVYKSLLMMIYKLYVLNDIKNIMGLNDVHLINMFFKRPFVCYDELMEYKCGRENACVVVDKTPSNVFFVDKIMKSKGDKYIIHIYRNPIEVISSMNRVAIESYKRGLNNWKNYMSIDFCIKKYNSSIRATYKYSDESSNYLLSYESMLGRECELLDEICKMIGIEHDRNDDNDYTKYVKDVISDIEFWKSENKSMGVVKKEELVFDYDLIDWQVFNEIKKSSKNI